MKICLSKSESYPDYDFSKKNLRYYTVWAEVSEEQIDKWDKIKLDYAKMQRELEELYEKQK